MSHPAFPTAPRDGPGSGMDNPYLCAFQGELRATTRVAKADKMMAHLAACPRQRTGRQLSRLHRASRHAS
jgi:hypothetical protein